MERITGSYGAIGHHCSGAARAISGRVDVLLRPGRPGIIVVPEFGGALAEQILRQPGAEKDSEELDFFMSVAMAPNQGGTRRRVASNRFSSTRGTTEFCDS